MLPAFPSLDDWFKRAVQADVVRLFHRLDHHVAHWFARQPTADPGTPGDDLAVTAILHEYARHDVAVVAGDLEAVRTPALVRFLDGYPAIMRSAAVPPLGRLRQQQTRSLITRYMRL